MIINMDCVAGMRLCLADNSVDAIVTDPPYELGFMGKGWDSTGIANSVEMWREALRVLKPGGHLLAFSGSRTYHRMACAIEDAGFEIRDQIMWVYGSGFPKSLNVSKAVDEARKPDTRLQLLPDEEKFCAWLREHSGLDEETVRGVTGSARFFTGQVEIVNTATKANPRLGRRAMVPTAEAWARLRERMAVTPPAWVEALVKEPPQPKGQTPGDEWTKGACVGTVGANEWAGWGTALKPAHEPICVARKPLYSLETNVLQMVESQLRAQGVCGEIIWKAESASGAPKSKRQPSSSSIQPQPAAGTSAASADASATPSAGPQSLNNSPTPGSDGRPATLVESFSTGEPPASAYDPLFSQPTAANAHAAASLSATSSPSITSPAAEAHIGARSTGKSTHSFGAKDSRPAIASYAGIATGLPGSMATVHIMQDESGAFLWPAGLPKSIPGGPLTVAANVLAHGTGALNIDGCRVGGNVEEMIGRSGASTPGLYEGGIGIDKTWEPNAAGRWPANLIHDGSDEVLAAFPEASGAIAAVSGEEPSGSTANSYGQFERRKASEPRREADRSAARFFYCAKASRTDRGEGNNHPTVKPLALMQYLVRLVTPPGGLVLDPFTGSGSTWAAAKREGFQFVGFELDPHYCAIATRRAEAA